MTARSSRLRRIIGFAEAEERQSALSTSAAKVRLAEELDRLAELGAHRQRYADGARRRAQQASVHWQDRQEFLSRLDDAVRSQQQIVADCKRRLEVHQRLWESKRRRVETLLKVMERFSQGERLQADRLDQRRLDDRPRRPGCFDGDG